MATLVCTFQSLNANIRINATAGEFGDSLLDQFGAPLSGGLASALVVDTTGGDFSSFFLSSGFFAPDSAFGGNSAFYVAATKQTEDFFGLTTVSQFSAAFDFASHPDLSAGDSFAILWFPEIAFTSSFNFGAGDSFGLTREDTWILPSDGGTFTSGPEGSAPGGIARNRVSGIVAVPESGGLRLVFGATIMGLVTWRSRKRDRLADQIANPSNL